VWEEMISLDVAPCQTGWWVKILQGSLCLCWCHLQSSLQWWKEKGRAVALPFNLWPVGFEACEHCFPALVTVRLQPTACASEQSILAATH